MEYLDQNNIAYDQVDVRGDEEKMKLLADISGQSRTPTMIWGGKVLANFGVDELKKFLDEQGTAQPNRIS